LGKKLGRFIPSGLKNTIFKVEDGAIYDRRELKVKQ